jgi:carboxylesterase
VNRGSDVHVMHPLAEGFRLEGGPGDGVLLLHGWTASPGQMRPLGDRLQREGFTVACPRLVGHGTRIEDLVGVGWRAWVRDAATAAQDLRDEGRRLHLVGLSMGGALSLLLAAVFEAASVTAINAPMAVWDRWARFAPLVRHSRRVRPDTEPPVILPEGMERYRQDYQGTPEGSAAELMDLVRVTRTALPRITCPALIVQSDLDETVNPASVRIIREGIGSGDLRVLRLEHSAHLAVLDRDLDLLAGEIVRHLRRAIRLMSSAVPDPYHPTTER